ncbi:MAG: hypothetical protein EB165_05630 [Euryarchaeota archaeon]|nr:hypothetical protein [Euryarchaeota archaeon]
MEFNYPFSSLTFTNFGGGVYEAAGWRNSGMTYRIERTYLDSSRRSVWTLTTKQYGKEIQVPISKKYTMDEKGNPMCHDESGFRYMTINFSAAKRVAALIDRQMRF